MARPYRFRLTERDYKRYETMHRYEHEAAAAGLRYCVGIDEAGRGPLAGPVCIGACMLDPEQTYHGLNDSKKLSEKRREYLHDDLINRAAGYAVIAITPDFIDRADILRATKLGMLLSVAVLSVPENTLRESWRETDNPVTIIRLKTPPQEPQAIFIDAVDWHNELAEYDRYRARFAPCLPPAATLGAIPAKPIIGGDAHSNSIAAASIFAKVERDRMMVKLSEIYPEYGWQTNKGYGTKEHMTAIRESGLTPHHRLSFVKKMHLGKVFAGETGAMAESRVADHLTAQGYRIVARNFRLDPFGEIDIICEKNNHWFIVEVKARQGHAFSELAEAAVDFRKRLQLQRVGAYFIDSKGYEPSSVRLLLAAAQLDSDNRVQHIRFKEIDIAGEF